MKVMCIAQTPPRLVSGPNPNINIKFPSFGDEFTVIGNHYNNVGKLYYMLDKYGPMHAFEADFFVPIEDIDQPELVKEKESVKE